MRLADEDITGQDVALAYESLVTRAATIPAGEAAAELGRLREVFQKRTGIFSPHDPWFDARSRAFWDFALTAKGFATRVLCALPSPASPPMPAAATLAPWLERAHRGLFVVADLGGLELEAARRTVTLRDLWSGAELLVRVLDDAQAIALTHAASAMDARVVSTGSAAGTLYLLPGAIHHADDAMEPLHVIVEAARTRCLSTTVALDALLRMELVLRSSSRVKATFAYRITSLPAAGSPP